MAQTTLEPRQLTLQTEQLENLIGTSNVKIYLQNNSQIVILPNDTFEGSNQQDAKNGCDYELYGIFASDRNMTDEIIAQRRSDPRE
jgi:hypothetical protein